MRPRAKRLNGVAPTDGTTIGVPALPWFSTTGAGGLVTLIVRFENPEVWPQGPVTAKGTTTEGAYVLALAVYRSVVSLKAERVPMLGLSAPSEIVVLGSTGVPEIAPAIPATSMFVAERLQGMLVERAAVFGAAGAFTVIVMTRLAVLGVTWSAPAPRVGPVPNALIVRVAQLPVAPPGWLKVSTLPEKETPVTAGEWLALVMIELVLPTSRLGRVTTRVPP